MADIIGAVRLTEPSLKMSATVAPQWATSSDGKHLAYIASRGDLATDKVIYRLLHVNVDAVRRFLRSDGVEPPAADLLVEFASSSNYLFQHAIRQAAWLHDNETIVFLGEAQDEPTQVYSYNVRTRALSQLTKHPRPVLSFAHDPINHRTVYVSTVPVRNYDEGAPAYVVDNGSVNMMLFPSRGELQAPSYQAYVSKQAAARGDTSKFSFLPVTEPFRGAIPSIVRLSPDGRRAVISITVNDLRRVRHWASSYGAISHGMGVVELIDSYDPYLTRFEPSVLSQFYLVDLESGQSQPLFDAPDGSGLSGFMIDAAWLPDSKHVILANTLLPLAGVDEAERHRREQAPAIVECNVETGELNRILDLPVRTSAQMRRFTGVKLNSPTELHVYWSDGRQTTTRKQVGTWVSMPSYDENYTEDQHKRPGVAFSIAQDMNRPPQIVATDLQSQAAKTLVDFGEQFRDRALSRVERFDWTDVDFQSWSGGLMFPPNGTRKELALVIQVGGFDPNQFVLDGFQETSSAFAGHALTGRGMLVLLLPRRPEGHHSLDGLRRYQRGIEAAIDHLARDGIIDRNKVGIIGFSATGNIARQMITFSDRSVAAATIADAWSYSLFAYTAYLYGFAFPMDTAERMIGAVPWGEKLQTWVDNDPSMHTDNVKAAVRIEQYGLHVDPNWDLYALLRRQHKPAELVVFPGGHHQLRKPRQRQFSLQGNVDWFAFWLMNDEDPDPAKADQYERWRQMRTLSEHHRTR